MEINLDKIICEYLAIYYDTYIYVCMRRSRRFLTNGNEWQISTWKLRGIYFTARVCFAATWAKRPRIWLHHIRLYILKGWCKCTEPLISRDLFIAGTAELYARLLHVVLQLVYLLNRVVATDDDASRTILALPRLSQRSPAVKRTLLIIVNNH